MTNSYSAEFGKATGGVVNIVTKSGTNEIHGNAFWYFRDESLNAKDHFEKFDVFGNSIDRDKAPFSAEPVWGDAGRAHQEGQDLLLPVLRAGGRHGHQLREHRTGGGGPPEPDGLPGADGGRPLRLQGLGAAGQGRPPVEPELDAWSSARTIPTPPTRTSSPSAASWPGAGAPCSFGRTGRSRCPRSNILTSRWVNEARVQVAKQDQQINSLDPNCGGPCDTNDKGGPDPRDHGRCHGGPTALHPATPREHPGAARGHGEPLRGQPLGQGGDRLQLGEHPRGRQLPAPSFRRTLHLRLPACDPRAHSRSPICAPGLRRQASRPPTSRVTGTRLPLMATRTSRSSCRTSGA